VSLTLGFAHPSLSPLALVGAGKGRALAIETGFDGISEFSEFRHGNHPEIHKSDFALFRFPGYESISLA
jgi:hypothetical protein